MKAPPPDAKIVSLAVARDRIQSGRARGQTWVLANGVFDLFHVGHLRYLTSAADEADHIIVAINSDRSTQANKGPDRPVIPEAERAEIVAGLGCVDLVTAHPFLRRYGYDAPDLSGHVPPYDPTTVAAPSPEKVIAGLYTHFDRTPLVSLTIQDISDDVGKDADLEQGELDARTRMVRSWSYASEPSPLPPPLQRAPSSSSSSSRRARRRRFLHTQSASSSPGGGAPQ